VVERTVVGGAERGDAQVGRHDLAEDPPALALRLGDAGMLADQQAVEEACAERHLAAHLVDVELAAEPPHGVLERLRPAVGAERASMGRTGSKRWMPPPASPAPPARSACAPTTSRSPSTMSASRTVAASMPAAAATASVSTPSSAPWRSSPTSQRARKERSGA